MASYGEDVAWVAATGLEACIYDATGSRAGLLPVPNQAREAGQYLHHIIQNFGQFRDYEIFLQGDPFPHNLMIMETIALEPWKNKRFEPLSFPFIPFNPNSFLPHSEHLIPFGFAINVTQFEGWHMGALFAASRESIEARPLHWWQALHEKVIREPWSPWVMEQLWMSIFNVEPSPSNTP